MHYAYIMIIGLCLVVMLLWGLFWCHIAIATSDTYPRLANRLWLSQEDFVREKVCVVSSKSAVLQWLSFHPHPTTLTLTITLSYICEDRQMGIRASLHFLRLPQFFFLPCFFCYGKWITREQFPFPGLFPFQIVCFLFPVRIFFMLVAGNPSASISEWSIL